MIESKHLPFPLHFLGLGSVVGGRGIIFELVVVIAALLGLLVGFGCIVKDFLVGRNILHFLKNLKGNIFLGSGGIFIVLVNVEKVAIGLHEGLKKNSIAA